MIRVAASIYSGVAGSKGCAYVVAGFVAIILKDSVGEFQGSWTSMDKTDCTSPELRVYILPLYSGAELEHWAWPKLLAPWPTVMGRSCENGTMPLLLAQSAR